LNRPRPDNQSAFVRAAVLAVVGLILFTAWLAIGIGGLRTTVAVDDIGEAVAAAVAAAACAVAARRGWGRTRLAWSLLSAAALSWTIGEVAWSIYEVGLNDAVPFPSPADLGFLLAVPLAVAGLLVLPLAPTRAATRTKSVLDGAIVALSLLFVCWVFVLGPAYGSATSGQFAKLIGLAYPVGDLVIASVVVIIAGRASGAERPRLVLLLGGYLAIAVADSAFAYLTGAGLYTVRGSVLDAAWVAGFLLIALAALRPAVDSSAAAEGAIRPWQSALPTLAFATAAASAFLLSASGRPLGTILTALAAGLGLLLVSSHLLSLADAADLLRLNRLAEAMMRRVDVAFHAPAVPAVEIASERRPSSTGLKVLGPEDNQPMATLSLSDRLVPTQEHRSAGRRGGALRVVGKADADADAGSETLGA
jgi:hypothetical protein